MTVSRTTNPANGAVQRKARAKKGGGAKKAPRLPVDQRTRVKRTEATSLATLDRTHTLIDKAMGPNGALILQALAVIAVGDSAARQTFFGEAFRVKASDRNFALAQLALRRFGRAPLKMPGAPGDELGLPVQIVNVFTDGSVLDVEPVDA